MTTPAWVPLGATIHIDLVGDQAWTQTDDVVAIDTLLGNDSTNTYLGWKNTEYNPTYLTADGYVYPAGYYDKAIAFIGAARDAIIAGTTMKFVVKIINSTELARVLFFQQSTDGDQAIHTQIYMDEPDPADNSIFSFSYNGDLDLEQDGSTTGIVGDINVIAFTITPTRLEFTANGVTPAVASVLTTDDFPTSGTSPLVASLFDLQTVSYALQAVTFFPTLATTTGLAEISADAEAGLSAPPSGAGEMDGVGGMVGVSVSGAAIAEMDGAASMSMVIPGTYALSLVQHITGGAVPAPSVRYHRTMSQNLRSNEITKAVSVYRLALQSAISQADAVSYKARFLKVLREIAITLTASSVAHTQYSYAVTDRVNLRPPVMIPKWGMRLSLAQSLAVTQTTSPKFIWGRILTQALKVSAALDARGHYGMSLAQLFKLIEVEGFKLSHPVTLSQIVNLSSLVIGGFSLKLLQKFLVATAASPAFHYHFSLTNRVIIQDTLEHLVKGILMELFTVHPALGRQFIANSSLAQLLTLHPALHTKLVLKIVGNIQLRPEQLVRMIYRGDPLLDGVVITALYISPSGTTTTWVVNTRTNAVTEYDNYDFRSFALMGNRYIAAGAEGLYELDGDTDDGSLIISRMMSGYLQLNEKKLFGIKGAYVAIRGGGRFYLKLISGDGREYVYELKAQPNLMTTKVKVGKGISTTYMAFELVTEGQDFDLDSIEFIPMTRGRRV